MLTAIILCVFTILIGCSKTSNPSGPIIQKNELRFASKAIPMDKPYFYLTGPSDEVFRSTDGINLSWSEPTSAPHNFDKWELMADGNYEDLQNSYSEREYTKTFDLGRHFWRIYLHGDNQYWANADGEYYINVEIDMTIHGPTVATPRNGQSWYVDTMSILGKTFSYHWRVVNILGQTVCEATTSTLSVSQIPTTIAYGYYNISLTVHSTSGNVYNCGPITVLLSSS